MLLLCPGVPVHRGNNHCTPFFTNLCLAVEHCWVSCIGSCEPVHQDRTNVFVVTNGRKLYRYTYLTIQGNQTKCYHHYRSLSMNVKRTMRSPIFWCAVEKWMINRRENLYFDPGVKWDGLNYNKHITSWCGSSLTILPLMWTISSPSCSCGIHMSA